MTSVGKIFCTTRVEMNVFVFGKLEHLFKINLLTSRILPILVSNRREDLFFIFYFCHNVWGEVGKAIALHLCQNHQGCDKK